MLSMTEMCGSTLCSRFILRIERGIGRTTQSQHQRDALPPPSCSFSRWKSTSPESSGTDPPPMRRDRVAPFACACGLVNNVMLGSQISKVALAGVTVVMVGRGTGTGGHSVVDSARVPRTSPGGGDINWCEDGCEGKTVQCSMGPWPDFWKTLYLARWPSIGGTFSSGASHVPRPRPHASYKQAGPYCFLARNTSKGAPEPARRDASIEIPNHNFTSHTRKRSAISDPPGSRVNIGTKDGATLRGPAASCKPASHSTLSQLLLPAPVFQNGGGDRDRVGGLVCFGVSALDEMTGRKCPWWKC